MKTLTESDADEVDPLMMDEEEVDPLLEGRPEFSNSIAVDSKEIRHFLGIEDVKIGLGSAPLLKSQEGWSRKLKKSLSSIEE